MFRVRLLAPLGRAVLFGGYALTLGLWLFAYIGHLFLSRSTEDTLSTWGFYVAPLFAGAIVLYAVSPPRRPKMWSAGVAFAVGILVFNSTWPLRAQSDRLYVQRHQSALNRLVADIIAYKRIHQMDHDYMHAVNGTFFLYPGAQAAPHLKRVPLNTVLARDSIDPIVYADFEHRLAELHLMAFWADGGEVTLARSRGGGLLYHPQDPPLTPRARLGNSGRIVRALAKDWYWYSSVG